MGHNFEENPVQRRDPDSKKNLFSIIGIILVLVFLPSIINKFKDLTTERIEVEEAITEPVEMEKSVQSKRKSAPRDVASVESGDINVSIGQDGFRIANKSGMFSYSPFTTQLGRGQFSYLHNEPDYSGSEQWYGYMDLGDRQHKRFYFVFDLQADEKFLMYFDSNNNGDLSDDGEPLVNKGSGAGGPGGFACELAIPWQVLIENAPFKGDFKIWFFSNEAGWKKGNRVAHYSRTQLEGAVTIGTDRYIAMLIDQGYNDADLSNDGIALDLNQNGKIDRDERPASTHVINGKKYTFNISW